MRLIFIVLFIANFSCKSIPNKNIVNIRFTTVEKGTKKIIGRTITKIFSNNVGLGVVEGDFDGISTINICLKKVVDKKITLITYGIGFIPLKKEYQVDSDLKLTIELEHGKTVYNSLKDKGAVLKEFNFLNVNPSDVNVNSENYIKQLCD